MDYEIDVYRLVDELENFMSTSGNNAVVSKRTKITVHGVGLATSSLAVGENSSVESIEDILNRFLSTDRVDKFLVVIFAEDSVKFVNVVVERNRLFVKYQDFFVFLQFELIRVQRL